MRLNPYEPPRTEKCWEPENESPGTSEEAVALGGAFEADEDHDDSDLPPDWWLKTYWSFFWIVVAVSLLGSLVSYLERTW